MLVEQLTLFPSNLTTSLWRRTANNNFSEHFVHKVLGGFQGVLGGSPARAPLKSQVLSSLVYLFPSGIEPPTTTFPNILFTLVPSKFQGVFGGSVVPNFQVASSLVYLFPSGVEPLTKTHPNILFTEAQRKLQGGFRGSPAHASPYLQVVSSLVYLIPSGVELLTTTFPNNLFTEVPQKLQGGLKDFQGLTRPRTALLPGSFLFGPTLSFWHRNSDENF